MSADHRREHEKMSTEESIVWMFVGAFIAWVSMVIGERR
jgi:hypothetical protein